MTNPRSPQISHRCSCARALPQTAAEYAADRADERGWPWAEAAAHLGSLRAHGVTEMGSGVLFAVQSGGREAEEEARGVGYPMEGAGGESEGLVVRAGAQIRRVCAAMLAGPAEEEGG